MAAQRGKPARGLVNMGNTCYLNSVVQALNSFPLFDKYISSLKQQGVSNSLLDKLKDTLDALKQPSGTPFRPSLVQDESLRKHFRPGEQQDAHEFLTFLLDAIVAGSAETGPTAVAEAKASGLASLLSATPEKEKPRWAIATTRAQAEAAALQATQHQEISLTQSSMLLTIGSANGHHLASPGVNLTPSVVSPISPLFTSNGASPAEGRASHQTGSPFAARMQPSTSFPQKNSRNIRESLSARSNGQPSTPTTPNGVNRLSASQGPNGTPGSSSVLNSLGSSFLTSSQLAAAVGKSKRALPTSPFLGKMESTIRCKSCEAIWSMIQPMTMLTAYIRGEGSCDLLDCITDFTRGEDVKGVKCQRCKTQKRVEKRLSVAKVPEILCIFINRLKFERVEGKMAAKKLVAHVRFEADFDLGKASSQLSLKTYNDSRYDEVRLQATDSCSALSGNYGHTSLHNGSTSTFTATSHSALLSGRNTPSEASSVASTSDFRESATQRLTRTNDDDQIGHPDYQYQLMAVIVHIGGSNGGHYIMFKATNREEPSAGPWLQISDSQVNEVSFGYVKQQHAYMLFYQKRLSFEPDTELSSVALQSSSAISSPIPISSSPTALHSSAYSSTTNGWTMEDEDDDVLPNGKVHQSDPLGSHSAHLSSSHSSSSYPTSSPDSEETKKSKLFLEPEESPEEGLNGSLRSAQDIPSDLRERPMQSLGDPHEGFNSIILTSRAES